MKYADYKCEIIKNARLKNEQSINWKGNVDATSHAMGCR